MYIFKKIPQDVMCQLGCVRMPVRNGEKAFHAVRFVLSFSRFCFKQEVLAFKIFALPDTAR